MSPRAACRLEALGFETVYDYEMGIADWKAAGLPLAGPGVGYQVASDAMRPDIPICSPTETLGEVERRVRASDWVDCLVVECDTKVVGRIRSSAWETRSDVLVEEVMEPGPTTVRANEPLEQLVERMDRRPTNLVIVTTPQGDLLGVVIRKEARRLLQGEHTELIWADCDGCPGQWRAARTRT
jgi:Mg/Co/Ni transporter MgtE